MYTYPFKNSSIDNDTEKLSTKKDIDYLDKIENNRKNRKYEDISKSDEDKEDFNKINREKLRKIEDEKRREKLRKIEDEKMREKIRKIEDEKRIEKLRKIEDEKRIEKIRKIEDEKRIEKIRKIEEEKRIEKLRKIEEEKNVINFSFSKDIGYKMSKMDIYNEYSFYYSILYGYKLNFENKNEEEKFEIYQDLRKVLIDKIDIDVWKKSQSKKSYINKHNVEFRSCFLYFINDYQDSKQSGYKMFIDDFCRDIYREKEYENYIKFLITIKDKIVEFFSKNLNVNDMIDDLLYDKIILYIEEANKATNNNNEDYVIKYNRLTKNVIKGISDSVDKYLYKSFYNGYKNCESDLLLDEYINVICNILDIDIYVIDKKREKENIRKIYGNKNRESMIFLYNKGKYEPIFKYKNDGNKKFIFQSKDSVINKLYNLKV